MTSSDQHERLVKMTGEHWIKYVIPTVIALSLFSISLLLFFFSGATAAQEIWTSHVSFLGGLFLLLLTFHWYFILLLSEGLDGIIITNRRLIRTKCRLFFEEEFLEVSFDKMKTVDAHKNGILQNLLHFGTLIFETNKATIKMVPNPNHIAELIQKAMMER